MVLTRDFWIGFVTGTVVGAVGYRLYEQNNGQLKRLVQAQSQALPSAGLEVTLEDLIAQKERLEDIIAEKQVGA